LSVADILNDYFVNMANGIGEPDQITNDDTFERIIAKHNDAQCIKRIRYDMAHKDGCRIFSFNAVPGELILEKLKR
jgi:hypothetical protein